jgi:C4-dicarboxylate transporter DctM subunit
MPVIVIGGIMTGLVTATEAGALAVFYGLIVGLFVHKSIRLKDLPFILLSTGKQTARIMIIIACASLFGWIISREIEPNVLVDGFLSISDQKWVFTLLFIIAVLLMGMIMEGGSIMIILTPLLLPILDQFNFDLVHFGVTFQLAIMIGLLTPPMGVLLFVISGTGNISIKAILREMWPFYMVLIVVLFLCAYIPELSLWLLNFMSLK